MFYIMKHNEKQFLFFIIFKIIVKSRLIAISETTHTAHNAQNIVVHSEGLDHTLVCGGEAQHGRINT